MSNSPKDNDDWGHDSAALFRGARRAHDPTQADRMAIDRVLMRIQAGSTVQPSASMGPARASRGATPATLLQIGKVSLAVLGVAAAYLAFSGADREPSAPPSAAAPASSAHALPTAAPRAEPVAFQPTATRSDEPDEIQPSRVVRRGGESPVRGTPRRPRVSTGRQRPSQSTATVTETPASTAGDGSSSASLDDTGQADSVRQPSASSGEAVMREPARRQTSSEPSVQQPKAAAARAATSAPPEAGTELAVLKRMQAALRSGDFTTVLALCAEHERRWPHGRFELEREGVHAIASCGVSSDDAVLLAKRFLAGHPNSSLALRVSSACARQLGQRL